MAKVSVIIPFHNASLYIKRCIISLKNQEYTDFEAIFVDDGSTDDSLRVFNKYKDSRFVCYSIPSQGVSVARNEGLSHATGEYIAFMDCDDTVAVDFLSRFTYAIESSNADIVISNYVEVYNNGTKKEIHLPWSNEIIDRSAIEKELIPRMIADEDGVLIRGLVWRTFTRRSFIFDQGICFIKDIKVAEDLLFTIQLYNRANSIYVIDDCIYEYHKNIESTVNSYRKNNIEDNLRFHQSFIKVLRDEGLYEDNYTRYLINRFSFYSYAISNAIRNPKHSEIKKELTELRKVFVNDSFDYSHLNITFSKRIIYYLLKMNFLDVLMLIYRMHEIIRRKKLI
ncbi:MULTISPECIES: glycosyltransferase [Bifidobacterium]|uniref:glycosyltransferase n=1 Tax=Bifidobacterium TaxID=1678 RepID=UPI001BDC6E3B|nr:glycosyltransferase [Bifidobacterium sp. SO1]MBW3079550.1 glycosyltransferase [Bifidobacterium simiiventris]